MAGSRPMSMKDTWTFGYEGPFSFDAFPGHFFLSNPWALVVFRLTPTTAF